ncbi:MAG: hypothetical protein R3F37_03885 [Candidatus Competibacteraceae bacterium]
MKIRAVLLAATAVFAASNAKAEPFNEGGIHYVYEAPAGSYQPRQPVVAEVERFNEGGQDYVHDAPAGTYKPRTYAESQAQRLTQSDNYSSGSHYQDGASIGWNN